MRSAIVFAFFLLIAAQMSCVGVRTELAARAIKHHEFEALLETLALGWNTNDSTTAISVFAEDAIYAEPPVRQLYVGRDEIFKFFGGEAGRPTWMKMVWHNISFNERRQTGAGEFTFSWEEGQVHGMVSIQIKNSLIFRWREYFYETDFEWDAFQKPSQFETR